MSRAGTSRRHVLLAGLATTLAIFALPDALAADTALSSMLRAGAGRADVALAADLFPLDGFAAQHDPLAVRVLLMEAGGRRTAITVVDLTSISDEMVAGFKAIVATVAAVAADDVLVCASHTFSAPHVFVGAHAPADTDMARNQATAKAFETALRRAVQMAVDGLRPARTGFGSGSTHIAVNRDVPTPHGWWLGSNDAGYTDPALGVLRIDDLDGKPLAIVMNAAVQPSVLDGSTRSQGGKLISADLAGSAAARVEAHYGGAVALFLVGAAGDQAPLLQANPQQVDRDGNAVRNDLHEAGSAMLDLLGDRLATDVVALADATRTQRTAQVQVRREHLAVPSQEFSPRNAPRGPVTTFDYRPGAPVSMPVALMRIGDVALVGIQPELAARIGAQIRAQSPFAHTIVATMVDGAAKYMPDAQSYDRFTYEARSSPFARGAAEEAAAQIVDRLKLLHLQQP